MYGATGSWKFRTSCSTSPFDMPELAATGPTLKGSQEQQRRRPRLRRSSGIQMPPDVASGQWCMKLGVVSAIVRNSFFRAVHRQPAGMHTAEAVLPAMTSGDGGQSWTMRSRGPLQCSRWRHDEDFQASSGTDVAHLTSRSLSQALLSSSLPLALRAGCRF